MRNRIYLLCKWQMWLGHVDVIVSSNTLQLHGVIYRPDSFVMMLHYFANLKVITYVCENVLCFDSHALPTMNAINYVLHLLFMFMVT